MADLRWMLVNKDDDAASELDHGHPYDVLIATAGYEQRSVHLPRLLCDRSASRWAFGFPDNHVLNYDENVEWYRKNDFQFSEPSGAEFADQLEQLARSSLAIQREERPLHVAVDISSMTRSRIASVVKLLVRELEEPICLDFWYSIARFSEHAGEEGPLKTTAPLPGFAGWTSDPGLPPVAILGIGYEASLALGVVELLEPSSVWIFAPHGEDDLYDQRLQERNHDLWSVVPADNCVPYAVRRPFKTFLDIESLLYGLNDSARPVLVPLGPKMFAAVALLAASQYDPAVSVWRVSPDVARVPADREPSGSVCLMRVVKSADDRSGHV